MMTVPSRAITVIAASASLSSRSIALPGSASYLVSSGGKRTFRRLQGL